MALAIKFVVYLQKIFIDHINIFDLILKVIFKLFWFVIIVKGGLTYISSSLVWWYSELYYYPVFFIYNLEKSYLFSPSSVFIFTACNGLGTVRCTAMGTMLADWLAGKRSDTIDYLLSLHKPEWNPPGPFLTMGVNFTLRRGMHNAGLEA